ncbi:BQ2448_6586 [Microbotryum intermedium]|uniref:BQ2448_6586 protein n=1 Tax=Microbotryum intermedium TaxID=269621 RepID=A0A238FQJ0_9BASI|nr:BQ2448_6586 [Microbotryum intermedium]
MAGELTAPLVVSATRRPVNTSTPPHATAASSSNTRSSTAGVALRLLQAILALDLVINLVYGTRTRLWIIWTLALARVVTVVVLIALHRQHQSRVGLGASLPLPHTPRHPHHPRSHHHHNPSRHRIHWIGIHVLVAVLTCLWYLNELVQRQVLFPNRHRTIALDLVRRFIHDPRAFYPTLSLGFSLVEYVAFIFVNQRLAPQAHQHPSSSATRRTTFGLVNADPLNRVQGDSPHQPDSELFSNDHDESDLEQVATETDNTNTDTETDTEAEADENEIIDVPKRGSAAAASLRSRASRASFFATAAENGISPRAVEEDAGVGVAVSNQTTSTSPQALRVSQNYGALS